MLPETQSPKMSSREIAEVVESRHDSVKRTMETLAEKQLIAFTQTVEKETGGRPGSIYHVNKRDSYIVVAQLSPEFTARLVDRWQELESQQPVLPDFTDPVAAARAWADAEEQKQKALAQVEAARPAVEFVGRYVESSSGSMNFRQVAKTLSIKENRLRDFLEVNKIMYRSGSGWLPYANHIDAGRFELKTGTSNGHSYTHPRFTAKGVAWLAKIIERD